MAKTHTYLITVLYCSTNMTFFHQKQHNKKHRPIKGIWDRDVCPGSISWMGHRVRYHWCVKINHEWQVEWINNKTYAGVEIKAWLAYMNIYLHAFRTQHVRHIIISIKRRFVRVDPLWITTKHQFFPQKYEPELFICCTYDEFIPTALNTRSHPL